MRYYRFIYSLLLGVIISLSVNASNERWRTYLSYTSVENIAQTTNNVFAVSSGSLFSFDKRDLSTEIYSKTTGLNDNNISFVSYSEKDEVLLIIYANSNIDVMAPRGVFNMPDLSQKIMAGGKKINDVYFNGGSAYLSTEFGIVRINIKNREFSDSYIIGKDGTNVSVKSLTIWNDSIYAITKNSIYTAKTSKNLANFQNWTQVDFPSGDALQSVRTFDDRLFLLKSSDSIVYVKDNQSGNWTPFAEKIKSMNISQNRLNLIKSNEVISYADLASEPISIKISYPCEIGVYDNNKGNFYIAANNLGLARVNKSGDKVDFYKPDGPALNDPCTMKFSQGKLYVATTGTWIFGSGRMDIPGAAMIYDGKSWLNITNDNLSWENQPFQSLLDILVDPDDGTHFYVGTWGKGLYEFRNNSFYIRYNSKNTNGAIQPLLEDHPDNYLIINGLSLDKDGNLWMIQSDAPNNLKVMKKDGTWKSFYFANYNNESTVQRTLIDKNGFIWLNQPYQDPGIFVFDYNGTIDNIADDNARRLPSTLIDQDGLDFSSTTYRSLVLDHKDPQKIWVGTSKGPIIIPDASQAFSQNFRVARIKVPRNDGTGLADYLLENEYINSIFVDGANRKWIGTRSSGALLVSEDGTETIHHFTTKNSPILSNNVLSITINPEIGEVFFGTDEGIVSFMGDATEGVSKFSKVYAYPNPVREDYDGVISIVGLVENSNVKITDSAGNLVYETTSNGGMATWDGNNIYGHRVSTGVYFALCSSEDGKEKSICKILVINK